MADLGTPLDLEALEAAGIPVTSIVTKIAGKSTAFTTPLRGGQRVVIVVDAVVDDIDANLGTGTLNRELKATELYDLDAEAGARVLSALRASRRTVDTTLAHDVLPGILATVDANGVVVTEAEKAALAGGAATDVDLDIALAWARENFGHAFDSDEGTYIGALDQIEELEPWAIRYLLLVEANGEGRVEVVRALDARLEEELERSDEFLPWDGYDKDPIDTITGRLETERVEASDGIRWKSLLEHVRRYETANKNRKGVLDFIETFVGADTDDDATTEGE